MKDYENNKRCSENSCEYYDSMMELHCSYSEDNSKCIKSVEPLSSHAVLGDGWRDARKELPVVLNNFIGGLMQKHIMIDIETMGNTPDSVIVSIGAVEFDLEKGLGRELYTNVSIQSCLDKGLKITESTLLWWLQQSKEQIEAFTKDTIPLGPALKCLRAFYFKVAGEDPYRPWVWGNGASFDITILENAYRVCEVGAPWDFYNVACYRTLKKVFNKVKKPVGEQVDKHNALSDAKFQARHALDILKYKKMLEEKNVEESSD